MKLQSAPVPHDRELFETYLRDFVPQRVFDFHAHLMHDAHFAPDHRLPFLEVGEVCGLSTYQGAMWRLMPQETSLASLFFGFPRQRNERSATNIWLAGELEASSNYGLALASPGDEPEVVAAQVRALGFVGLKPYHVYATRPDTANATLEEFVPEWMWQLCDELPGVLMIHLVRDRAIADETNQRDLRRLCRKYPNCRVVLAHIGRAFNYRHAREGLRSLADLDNVWLDTSGITEAPAFAAALKTFGPRRILFGTDYPVSEIRGRCVALGDTFHWIDDEAATLVGIESLLCLREACDDAGLTRNEVQDIFHGNALRVMKPHFR